MNFGVQAQQLAVDFAVVRPFGISVTAQPVLGNLLQLAHAFAEHLESSDQSCVPVREDIGRGLCAGSGVRGGCGECEQVDNRSWCTGEWDEWEGFMRVEKVVIMHEGGAL